MDTSHRSISNSFNDHQQLPQPLSVDEDGEAGQIPPNGHPPDEQPAWTADADFEQLGLAAAAVRKPTVTIRPSTSLASSQHVLPGIDVSASLRWSKKGSRQQPCENLR
jgi:hypothetical protein